LAAFSQSRRALTGRSLIPRWNGDLLTAALLVGLGMLNVHAHALHLDGDVSQLEPDQLGSAEGPGKAQSQ